MRKILILPLIIILIFAFSCNKRQVKETSVNPDKTSCILLIGLDDAAQNMDVLCFVSYKENDNVLSFVQIPRDTFFDFGGTQNKINQLFSFYHATENRQEAMTHAATDIINAFGISCDGYVAITTKGLHSAIDAVGGIDIDVDSNLSILDESGELVKNLHPGLNHLNGEESVQFIRYRKGYATGDLGRLDAQKLFFRGVLKRFTDQLTLDKLIGAFLSVKQEVTTNLNVLDLLQVGGFGFKKLSYADVNYLTIPGEAAISQRGISYYVANKRGCTEICSHFLFASSDSFDRNGKFKNENEISFQNIYNDKNNNYRVYDNDSLGGIHIPKKLQT